MLPSCRLEKETVEKKKADAAAALQQRKEAKRGSLGAEPPLGSPGTATIRIRMPDGSTPQRRFLANQPLQVSMGMRALPCSHHHSHAQAAHVCLADTTCTRLRDGLGVRAQAGRRWMCRACHKDGPTRSFPAQHLSCSQLCQIGPLLSTRAQESFLVLEDAFSCPAHCLWQN